jgi:hypothetical protein
MESAAEDEGWDDDPHSDALEKGGGKTRSDIAAPAWISDITL